MLNDKKRNKFYEGMIKEDIKNKTVLEIGAGLGLMSILAAKYGAQHVYACEMNPLLFMLARANINKSGFKNKITLLYGHSDSIKIPEKVDIILSELISTDITSEQMVPTLKKAKQFLKRGGRYLPPEISINACLISTTKRLSFQLDPIEGITENLEKLTLSNSHLFDLTQESFKVCSSPVEVFKISDGFKFNKKLPIKFTIKKTKITGRNLFLCLYFSITSNKKIISSLDLKKQKTDSHWGTMLWKVTEEKSEYTINLREKNGRFFCDEID